MSVFAREFMKKSWYFAKKKEMFDVFKILSGRHL